MRLDVTTPYAANANKEKNAAPTIVSMRKRSVFDLPKASFSDLVRVPSFMYRPVKTMSGVQNRLMRAMEADHTPSSAPGGLAAFSTELANMPNE